MKIPFFNVAKDDPAWMIIYHPYLSKFYVLKMTYKVYQGNKLRFILNSNGHQQYIVCRPNQLEKLIGSEIHKPNKTIRYINCICLNPSKINYLKDLIIRQLDKIEYHSVTRNALYKFDKLEERSI